MSFAYPKTENLLRRDEETHKLIPGEFRERTFEQVGTWHVTEKIDGTNIRLMLTEDGFSVQGRSDNATLPKGFIEQAVPHIDAARMALALHAIDPDCYATGIVVYGEGYGPGIQKVGVGYAEKKSLRIFDVLTLAPERKPLWRSWAEVDAVAAVLELATSPVIYPAFSTASVVQYVQSGHTSLVSFEEGSGDVPMEGVVCRTDPYLYDSRGSRVKFKLKAHDLA